MKYARKIDRWFSTDRNRKGKKTFGAYVRIVFRLWTQEWSQKGPEQLGAQARSHTEEVIILSADLGE